MHTQIIHQFTQKALEGKTTFLETITALRDIEVERYYAPIRLQ